MQQMEFKVMKCEKAQELFSDHLEGLLERPMAVAFDQHIAECCDCERDYLVFRTTWQMLEALPEVAPPPGFSTDVVVKLRLQQEAARRARPRWQVIWSDLFTSRVPVRAFAGVAAAFALAVVIVNTPLGGVIRQFPIPTFAPHAAPIKVQAPLPAEEWLNSGLKFELGSSTVSTESGVSVFGILLKADGVTNQRVDVFVTDPNQVRFDEQSLKNCSVVFTGSVDKSGQVLPFILSSNPDKDVITAIVKWEHHDKTYLEAVFVPTNMMSSPANGSVRIENENIYSALRKVSASFGAVILANADIDARVKDVNITNGSTDDALYKICSGAGLSWRLLGNRVWIVERK